MRSTGDHVSDFVTPLWVAVAICVVPFIKVQITVSTVASTLENVALKFTVVALGQTVTGSAVIDGTGCTATPTSTVTSSGLPTHIPNVGVTVYVNTTPVAPVLVRFSP